LGDERHFAADLPVPFGINELENQAALRIEWRRTAVKHHFTVADARVELTKTERQASTQGALAQGDKLRRGMHQLANGPADDPSRAHAQETLGGRVQVDDRKRVVEDDDGGREPLEDVVGVGLSACALAQRLERR
jgi:hypothetical protein